MNGLVLPSSLASGVGRSSARAHNLHIGSCRIEEGVRKYPLAGFHQLGVKQVLGCSPLVSGYDLGEPEDLAYRISKTEEASSTCLALVTPHETRPLIVAHSSGAGIGQEIDVNIFCGDAEEVVTSLD